MNTYKLGILKAFKNGTFKSNVIEFEAGGASFKHAVLSLIADSKEHQDSFLFCPETLCPITFDYTFHFKAVTGNHVPVDRFALTYADMIKSLDETRERPDLFKKTIRPCVRTLYSRAGTLGPFLTAHGNQNINLEMDNKEESLFFGPNFESLDRSKFIKNKAA